MKAFIAIFVLLVMYGTSHAQEILVEEIPMTNGDIEIPGELTYPKSEEKIPLVVFVHGSGNGDRNGNQSPLVNTNLIKQLADSLTIKGFGFYRYDKRSSIPENMERWGKPSLLDIVADVNVVIDYFGSDKRFSGIHLIGHSQGSLIAMMANHQKARTFTSLAGAGTTIDQTLIGQITAQNQELGKITEQHIKELIQTDTIQQVNPFLLSIFAPKNQSYLKEWISLDPIKEIKTVNIPVLIINGDSDTQISLKDAQRLKDAKSNAELVVIPKMNHVLKTVENPTENTASYSNPDFPLSVELIKELVEFISSNG
ncbi:alpha/beta hydrolase [Muricauda sp. SCSIO 64092]|uniref:alpha/beta hydrolase family protein n=1 Tax=Allomuricauda sp. SCSIO 64092 TaxID=2908842 RepID=UPI001FF24BAC|nr:alpha/beta fold hydrolase [Muricauda sp. SCSIO 64092]UOY07378.1 alpha/beta hydrolase [Muricauda sp. SCSIO 64092]